MQNNLNKVARDTDLFLKKFFKTQVKSPLLNSMSYGLFSGGKKIRSKILVDVGKIFDVDYKKLIIVGSAVECIHSYSLIHDDLPCMDNDKLRRGKPTVHIKFGESTAVLAGNSLLTLSSEILTSKLLKLDNSIKINLIKKISECSGHLGIAGGQYLDLSYEHKKVSKKKVLQMEIKKTGKLFSFCCMAPLIIKKKDSKLIKVFDQIGSDIGLLFQIVDDLIDYMGQASIAGKKTRKDEKQGKATLISLLGYKNAIKYKNNLISNLHKKLSKFGSKSYNLIDTLDYIATRNK
jgi:farnesyl diphosphate synthase